MISPFLMEESLLMSDQSAMLNALLKALDDNQAINIKVIDVRQHTTVTDFMIICSGRANRHVKAIGQKVMEEMKKTGCPALSCTGIETGDWVLIDFGDFIIHVMQPESRQFYNLEGLWEDAL